MRRTKTETKKVNFPWTFCSPKNFIEERNDRIEQTAAPPFHHQEPKLHHQQELPPAGSEDEEQPPSQTPSCSLAPKLPPLCPMERGGALRAGGGGWWGGCGESGGGRGLGISGIGSWVGLTWSNSRQHWQWVVGERHAGGPRLGGQGAEIEFPRLLMRTRRRESWQKGDQQNGRTETRF